MINTQPHIAKAELFRSLGHPIRIRMIELLRERERTVGELQSELGIDSSGASQHLAVLRKLGVVRSRKEGTSVHCSIADPRILELLAVARGILLANLRAHQGLMDDLAAEAGPQGRGRAVSE